MRMLRYSRIRHAVMPAAEMQAYCQALHALADRNRYWKLFKFEPTPKALRSGQAFQLPFRASRNALQPESVYSIARNHALILKRPKFSAAFRAWNHNWLLGRQSYWEGRQNRPGGASTRNAGI